MSVSFKKLFLAFVKKILYALLKHFCGSQVLYVGVTYLFIIKVSMFIILQLLVLTLTSNLYIVFLLSSLSPKSRYLHYF